MRSINLQVNGQPLVFTGQSVSYDGHEFYYNKMSNVTHRGGDQPAYLFDYEGERLSLPYDPKDKSITLKIFQQIVALEKKREEMAQPDPPKEEPVEPAPDGSTDFSLLSESESQPQMTPTQSAQQDLTPEPQARNNNNVKLCKACGKEIPKSSKNCPFCGAKNSRPIYKRWWFIIIVIIAVLCIIGSALSGGDDQSSQNTNGTQNATQETVQTKESTEAKSDVPKEYESALAKAKIYSDTMHMSKAGIYDQLTSEYGEKFSAEAAQYAIDHLKADYKENALKKAKTYQDDMNMSPESIRDQLTSEYGEKFTKKEADYAIKHLND